MRNVTLTRTIAADKSAIWDILADFPNISRWNSGVTNSVSTSEATEGVGASRHCDLAPLGGLEETIREWEPGTKIAISIDSAKKLPIKSGLASFSMTDAGDETSFEVSYDYQPRFGPLGSLLGPVLDKQFKKGFSGFLDDLETAAKAGAAS